MNRSDVQGWLDRYVEAWKTYDADRIRALWVPDATYRYRPYDREADVVRGREAIVLAWVDPHGTASTRDDPGTYDAQYEPYAIDGDRAFAIGTTTYYTDASRARVRRRFSNVYLLRFAPDGRCAEFSELWMEQPIDG
jgi:hypothetical protein